MNTSRRCIVVLVAGTVALLISGVEAQPDLKTEGIRFVKVGKTRINVDQIAYTSDEDGALVIHFSGDRVYRLHLKGAEADAMRRWLDERSPDLMASKRAKVIMEGVDINRNGPNDPGPRPILEVVPR
jgi:hypothetical protein